MDFNEAEARFRELQQRLQRGEQMDPAVYGDQLRQLAVHQDGVWWEIDPQTGKWMYFDGSRWIEGVLPGRTASAAVTRASSPLWNKPPSTIPRPVLASSRLRLDKALPTLTPPREKHVTLGYTHRARQGERGRIAIPLMIGGITLVFCVTVFLGGRFLFTEWLPPSTPMDVRITFPTRTPEPTMVRAPTPTPTPIPVSAQVIEARVNVRGGPNLNDKIVDRVQKGTLITLISRNADGTWYQVIIAGRTEPAWVFGETVEIISGDPNSLPILD